MRRRSPLFIVLAAAAAVVLAAGCSSGGKKHDAAKPAQNTNAAIVLKAGDTTVSSYGPQVKISDKVKRAVVADAQTFVDASMSSPYDTGQLGPKFAGLFEPGLRKTATTTDIGVLTDVRVGKATYKGQATPVIVSGLADGSGKFVYLATRFTVTADVTTADGPIKVRRDLELTFAPSGGGWLVTGYRARMTRTLPGGTTTTSVANSSGSTTP